MYMNNIELLIRHLAAMFIHHTILCYMNKDLKKIKNKKSCAIH